MSLASRSQASQRRQPAQPVRTEGGTPPVTELDVMKLLSQGGLSGLALGGQSARRRQIDNEMLQQIIAGMSGSGLFGQ